MVFGGAGYTVYDSEQNLPDENVPKPVIAVMIVIVAAFIAVLGIVIYTVETNRYSPEDLAFHNISNYPEREAVASEIANAIVNDNAFVIEDTILGLDARYIKEGIYFSDAEFARWKSGSMSYYDSNNEDYHELKVYWIFTPAEPQADGETHLVKAAASYDLPVDLPFIQGDLVFVVPYEFVVDYDEQVVKSRAVNAELVDVRPNLIRNCPDTLLVCEDE